MSALVSSTTTTAAAAASNAATLYAVLLEKCGPAAAAAAGWAQERYLLFVDAAVLRFDDGLALLDPAQANYVRDVAAASQDVVASLARFLASLVASGEPGAAAVYYRTRELRQRKPKPKVRRTTIAGAADVAASRERTLTLRRRFADGAAAPSAQLKFWAVVGACWFCRGAAHALPFAPSDFRSSKLGSVAAAGAEARGAGLVWLSLGALRGRARLRRARRDRGPLGAAGRPAAAAVAAERAAAATRSGGAAANRAARRRSRRARCWRRRSATATRGSATVAEVASDADGWRAAAVGCFAAMTVRAVAAGAVAVGFGVPVLATLRCVRAPRATALGDAKMLRYLAFWAAVGLRGRLLNDSIHRIHAWSRSAPTSRSSSSSTSSSPFRGAQRPRWAQAKLADVAPACATNPRFYDAAPSSSSSSS
ncbi:hypothetical protein JL722_14562 [Aureococcus anophagefferens]|nr:hypothetical protein JL722_14562 [Aureococcus anophagefferens]